MPFYSQFEFLINTICFRSISEEKIRINELDVSLKNAIIKILKVICLKGIGEGTLIYSKYQSLK